MPSRYTMADDPWLPDGFAAEAETSLTAFIRRHGLAPASGPDGCQVFLGATPLSAGTLLPPTGFMLLVASPNGQLRVWVSEAELAVLTCCDHDLHLVKCESAESFAQECLAARTFYQQLDVGET